MSAVGKFKAGDLVWGKMKNFPAWPARVIDPPKGKKVHVFFFGTKDHAFLPEKCVTPHSRSMLHACKQKKLSSSLRAAVNEIEAADTKIARRRSSDAGHTMQRRPATLVASIKVRLKKCQNLKKRTQKAKVTKKKDPQPITFRLLSPDIPYSLRPRVVKELKPKPAPEEPMPEPTSLPCPCSQPSSALEAQLLARVCELCMDSKGATDPKISTPCCKMLYHMSCIVFWNKRFARTRCPGCLTPQNIGLRIKMTEPHKIDFVYEYRQQSRLGLFVGL